MWYPGEGNGNPLHYSCLDKGAWQATVYGVARVRHNLALSFFFMWYINHSLDVFPNDKKANIYTKHMNVYSMLTCNNQKLEANNMSCIGGWIQTVVHP